jgi:crossover junction endodeoxyribonuclease RusA
MAETALVDARAGEGGRWRLEVRLAWPAHELSPNARVHHMTHARAKKAAKRQAHFAAWEAHWHLQRDLVAGDAPLQVHLRFVPPYHRARDEDNAVASMKAALDGLAAALCIDDRRFRITHELARDQVGGFVEVSISPGQVEES